MEPSIDQTKKDTPMKILLVLYILGQFGYIIFSSYRLAESRENPFGIFAIIEIGPISLFLGLMGIFLYKISKRELTAPSIISALTLGVAIFNITMIGPFLLDLFLSNLFL